MLIILDTDHASLAQRAHAILIARLGSVPEHNLATTVISYQEQLQGRLAVVRRAPIGPKLVQSYHWLHQTLEFYCQMQVLAFDDTADLIFQRLLALRLRVGIQDLRIASVVLANQGVLLTRNQRDYSRVPGLVIEDWTQPAKNIP